MPILYDAPSPAPNPRRVRIYLAEKGLSVPVHSLSIVAGEHKGDEFVAKYPPGQLPVLALDDGRMIGESVAICRYFEALHPEPPLFGVDPVSIAEIDMWMRRVEFTLMMPVGISGRTRIPSQRAWLSHNIRILVKATARVLRLRCAALIKCLRAANIWRVRRIRWPTSCC